MKKLGLLCVALWGDGGRKKISISALQVLWTTNKIQCSSTGEFQTSNSRFRKNLRAERYQLHHKKIRYLNLNSAILLSYCAIFGSLKVAYITETTSSSAYLKFSSLWRTARGMRFENLIWFISIFFFRHSHSNVVFLYVFLPILLSHSEHNIQELSCLTSVL